MFFENFMIFLNLYVKLLNNTHFKMEWVDHKNLILIMITFQIIYLISFFSQTLFD
jgi:hypothetical protein